MYNASNSEEWKRIAELITKETDPREVRLARKGAV
jgi:hypothetical protein